MKTQISLERIGITAMVALTLAPLIFHSIWLGIAGSFGLHVDALGLTLGSLLVIGGLIAGHIAIRRHTHGWSLLIATGLGACVGAFLGIDFRSWLSISGAFLLLALIESLLIATLYARLPQDLDGKASRYKLRTGLLAMVACFALVQTARLSTFMGDANQTKHSMMPDIEFFKSHSCLTAYVHAVKLADAGERNIYQEQLWPDELDMSAKRDAGPDSTGPYAPFFLDSYMYPPQFLLLPKAVLSVSDEFLVQRALWFGLSGMFMAMSFWMIALWAGEQGKWHALLLIPVLWSCMITLITLQIGNVHHVVMAMAVLAMVAFQRKKSVWGGALLAFAILSKISPGILVVILIAQRRWRDLAWTLAFGMGYTLLTVLVFGIDPVQSFLTYQLPRIASGDTMKWFASLDLNILVNSSPFGIPFKLSMLGIQFDDVWATARTVNSLFTLLIVVVTAWAATKTKDRTQQLSMWLGVLTLSSLQSPFAPGYVVMPVIWLLTVLASEVRSVKVLVPYAMVFLLLAIPLPIIGSIGALYSLFQQVLVLGVIALGLFYRPTPAALAPGKTKA